MARFDWLSILLSQVAHLPVLLVVFVGIILAITRWSRHPTVSLLVLIAFLLHLANRMMWSGFQLWQALGGSWPGNISHLYTMMSVFGTVFYVTGQGLLIAAVFGWRSAPQSFPQDDSWGSASFDAKGG